MTGRARVWVTQPVEDEVLAPLRRHFDVRVETAESPRTPAQMRAGLADVDGAIVFIPDRVDSAALAGASHLRAVANVGVGHDNLDLGALAAAGVVATNTPDVLTETTADFAWALLLAAARRLGEAERWLRDGRWTSWSFGLLLGRDLHGTTLGILGMGRIGQAIARRARGFGMRVLYHNRRALDPATEADCAAAWVDLDALFERSDHLVVAVPLTAASRHVVDAARIARMKPTATLVNIARGGVVDEAALADALRGGRLAAAGLDVFEGEPRVDPALLACTNAVLTPHIASATAATRRAMVARAVANLVAALGVGPDAGEPRDRLSLPASTPGAP